MTQDTSSPSARTDADLLLDLRAHLPYRIARLANLIRQTTSDTYLAAYGLGGREWRVLGMLGFRGPLSAAQTADLTGMDPATITRAVDRLVAAGLARRTRDPGDRRRSRLSVTAKGRRLCTQALPHMRRENEVYSGMLSPREQRLLFDVLDRLEARAVQRLAQHPHDEQS